VVNKKKWRSLSVAPLSLKRIDFTAIYKQQQNYESSPFPLNLKEPFANAPMLPLTSACVQMACPETESPDVGPCMVSVTACPT
jgi:hypothetical protein